MDHLPTVHQLDTLIQRNQQSQPVQKYQEVIYKFLLEIVRQWSPDEVIKEFKNLFIHQTEISEPEALQALYKIVFENDEIEFRNTLKRCCYILINNWYAIRYKKAIQDLIEVFEDEKIHEETISKSLNKVRCWLDNFINSKDYEELKLFAAKFGEGDGHWAHRYTCYLLVPQYIDLNNPQEQREAARALSKHLKDKFKFDLAMYTAYSQTQVPIHRKLENPTGLGDEVLRLIKKILVKRGPFSYANLAHIFIKQTETLSYKFYKQSLSNYLVFYVRNQRVINIFNRNLATKLELLYADHDEDIVNSALVLRTCNRVIEFLTTGNKQEPSELFVLLLSQGNPLTLVVILLKLILVSPNSRIHLEACIAALIEYYKNYPASECQWIIYFLELFNITFAIYAENVEYNLIHIPVSKNSRDSSDWKANNWRIFSQLRQDQEIETPTEDREPDETNGWSKLEVE